MTRQIERRIMYVHDQPFEEKHCDLWPADDPRQRIVHYMFYEEPVEVEIDVDTGEYRYTHFAGIELRIPTEWFS